MKMPGYSFALMFLFILSFSACDLLFPPQYYQNIVAKGQSSGGG